MAPKLPGAHAEGRSDRSPGKLNNHLDIVRTGGVVERCPVPSSLSATPAAADDDPSLLTAILHTDRLEQTSARVGPVSRKVVDMLREEAIGTVVTAATVHQGRHLAPTVEAGKALVYPLGCKAPHSTHPQIILPCRLACREGPTWSAAPEKPKRGCCRGHSGEALPQRRPAQGGNARRSGLHSTEPHSRTPLPRPEGSLRWST